MICCLSDLKLVAFFLVEKIFSCVVCYWPTFSSVFNSLANCRLCWCKLQRLRPSSFSSSWASRSLPYLMSRAISRLVSLLHPFLRTCRQWLFVFVFPLEQPCANRVKASEFWLLHLLFWWTDAQSCEAWRRKRRWEMKRALVCWLLPLLNSFFVSFFLGRIF